MSSGLDISTAKSLNKIESLQKSTLQFLYNYSISYEDLLKKAGKVKMNVNRLRNLCDEIYKTINIKSRVKSLRSKRIKS